MKAPIARLAALVATVVCSSAQAGVNGPTPVVMSGDPAPGGGTFRGFHDVPVLNSSGQIAFRSYRTTGEVAESGIFAGAPGAMSVVAFQGAATPAGGNYSGFSSRVQIDDSGHVAFSAEVSDGSSITGIFYGSAGSMQTVALDGMIAPRGGKYKLKNILNGNPPFTLGRSGLMAFTAFLAEGSSTSGVFAGPPGALEAIALAGSPAPMGTAFATFGKFPQVSKSGLVTFSATLGDGRASGVFAGLPDSIETLVFTSTRAPGGGTVGIVRNFEINDAGQVIYFSYGLSPSTRPSILLGSPQPDQIVAIDGMPAPGGGLYDLNGGENLIAINDAGHVAFSSRHYGNPSDGGVFAGPPGSLRSVVREGEVAPDGLGHLRGPFRGIAINGSGQVVFHAGLTGDGVTLNNYRGLYGSTAGKVFKIVRLGDTVDVDPSDGVDNRIVSDLDFMRLDARESGRNSGFNDAGLLAYRLTFTDGTSGIFTSQIVIPEPGGAVLLITGIAVLLAAQARYEKGVVATAA